MRRWRSTTLTAAAAALLLLVLLTAAYMSIVSYGERREEDKARQMFVGWKATYNKTYSSIGEEEHRYAVFKVNRRRVDRRHIDADAQRYSYHGLNFFGDFTREELRRRFWGCEMEEGAGRQVPGRQQREPAGIRMVDGGRWDGCRW
ncbi:hypothetical protein QYE76_071546 [Lolium multiflorum]|uniref:Cathepsin propeptide inhibitor domain-containing protein n=1 Tax=Lolium multiflorum TaxID=4521 RepID=A0AAD8SLS8_LOLMU|nr:hypothetical protein QYE76_071546 [Lolium multiflorum]